jgi:hypothetical protein
MLLKTFLLLKVKVLGVGTSGRGEDIREGYRRVNLEEILCMKMEILLKLSQE